MLPGVWKDFWEVVIAKAMTEGQAGINKAKERVRKGWKAIPGKENNMCKVPKARKQNMEIT